MKSKPKIFTVVPEDEFVDRERILDILYTNALDAAREASNNTFIIGRRRIGKSAILTRLYDKLFFEQDIVVPFYFTFENLASYFGNYFAESYFTSFVSQYLAFKKKDVLIIDELTDLNIAYNLAQEINDSGLIHILKSYLNAKKSKSLFKMLNIAIGGPRMVSNINQSPICAIVDEFQNILKIVDRDGSPLNLQGLYQFGVEGTYCPHFVSGSAVSIIMKEILTRGALVGRFGIERVDKLELEYALELGRRLSKKYKFELPEEQNIYLANYTEGLPYYINRILYAVYKSGEKLVNEEVLSEAISRELTHGTIYNDLEGQILDYAERNDLNIVRSVLYFAANYEEERIDPGAIAKKLKVSEIKVSKTLSQMARADLIFETNANLHFNIDDPVMRQFLKNQYVREIMKIPPDTLEYEETLKLKKQLNDLQRINGILIESHIKLLMVYWDNRIVNGNLFGIEGNIKLPKFERIFSTKVKPPKSKEYQIDSLAAYTENKISKAWIGES
ncbi:MAG: ATP-binding protein, partial [Methanosarcinales archaeon]